MAVAAYLLRHTPRAGDQIINGITAMNLAIDDAVDTTTALIKARGVTVARANGHPLPDNYFDATPLALTAYATAGEYTLLGDVVGNAVT